jgi:hypothetical protein
VDHLKIVIREHWSHLPYEKMKRLILCFLVAALFVLSVYAVVIAQTSPSQEVSPNTDSGWSPAQAEATTTPVGADTNPTGNPIGGGPGYSNVKDPATADYVVSSRGQLLNALAGATSGQIIYVADSAKIDMSGLRSIVVPEGVTLASGRGRDGSLGGLIYTKTMTYHYEQLFLPQSHVIFSGIRLRGPDGSIRTNGADPTVTGIWCSGYHGLVVENCEVYQWPFSGISVYEDGLSGLSSPDVAYIHHNSIHNNRRDGYGYGVSVGQASALIEANLFDYNRHSVEGERGTPAANYEARYNIAGPHASNHCFDCHGGDDTPDWGFESGPDASVPAGGTILIHHNTFESAAYASVTIRGVPETMCDVYNNWTYWPRKSYARAFEQSVANLGLTPYANMAVHDNWYGTEPPP